MIHRNIICAYCEEPFTYESQRTKPKPYCTSRCKNLAKYWADPDRYRAAAREHHRENKVYAEKYRHETQCEHCGVAFCHQTYKDKANRFCSADCVKANHYVENKADYLDRARTQRDAPDYLEKSRASYYANRDKRLAKSKEWREKNADVLREKHKAYYEANKEARQAYYREWVADPANRQRVCDNARRWAEENPEKVRAHKAIRRQLKREQTVEVFDPYEVFDRDGWICQLCNEPVDVSLKFPDRMSKSLDHIIPISRGGEHSRANTQLAHFGCNASKNDKLPEEFQDATGTRAYAA